MNVIEYPDRDLLAMDVGNTLAGDLKNCLLRHEWASFAVPGGTTPGPIYDVLCAADLDWARVHVMLTDERWVPEGHERSNAGLLKERLLTERAAAATFLPFYVDGKAPDQAVAALSERLAPEMPISLLLLGMGTDMHTASLFPGAKGLTEALAPDAAAVMPIRAEGQEPRVTLTLPALNGAMTQHLVIFGSEKRAALERAMALPPEEAPVGAGLQDMNIHWAE